MTTDQEFAVLRTLHRGQIVTGTVTEIAPFFVTFVDIGGSFTSPSCSTGRSTWATRSP